MKLCFLLLDDRLLNLKKPIQLNFSTRTVQIWRSNQQYVARASPRLRSLSVTGLVTSTVKFCYVSLNFGLFQLAFVKQKIPLCSGKDCCISEEKLSCDKQQINADIPNYYFSDQFLSNRNSKPLDNLKAMMKI